MMKKAGLTVIVAGVVAGIATSFVLLNKGGRGASSLEPARLLPTETLFLAELPDLPGSRARWQETSLAQILKEPEVVAFLERPLSHIPKDSTLDAACGQLKKAGVERGFLAVTGLEGNFPLMAAGFSFTGPRSEVTALLEHARKAATKASPGGKTDLTKHLDYEIESFTDSDITLAWAYDERWFFITNQVELLKTTLERYQADKEEGTLAAGENYRKSFAPLTGQSEARFFIQPGPLVDRWIGLMSVSGQQVTEEQAAAIRAIKGIAGHTRFDGRLLRDAIYLYAPDAPKLPEMTAATLATTTRDTLVHYAGSFLPPDKLEIPDASGIPDTTGLLSFLETTRNRLAAKGLADTDPKTIFGTEFSLQADWPASALHPLPLASLKIADATKAQEWIDTVLEGWTKEVKEGIPFWSASGAPGVASMLPSVRLTAALTGEHFILGITPESVSSAAARPAGSETLAGGESYGQAFATLPKANTYTAFLDTKPFFERLYGSLRPMAMLWVNFIPNANTYVEIAKLPQTETIAKHLLPMGLSSQQQAEGTLIESAGSFTAHHGGAFIGLSVAAVAIPYAQGMIPGVTPPAALPQGNWQPKGGTAPAPTAEPPAEDEQESAQP